MTTKNPISKVKTSKEGIVKPAKSSVKSTQKSQKKPFEANPRGEPQTMKELLAQMGG